MTRNDGAHAAAHRHAAAGQERWWNKRHRSHDKSKAAPLMNTHMAFVKRNKTFREEDRKQEARDILKIERYVVKSKEEKSFKKRQVVGFIQKTKKKTPKTYILEKVFVTHDSMTTPSKWYRSQETQGPLKWFCPKVTLIKQVFAA